MKKYYLLMIQMITVIIIFCAITMIKFVFPKTFSVASQIYLTYFCAETDINLVLGEQD